MSGSAGNGGSEAGRPVAASQHSTGAPESNDGEAITQNSKLPASDSFAAGQSEGAPRKGTDQPRGCYAAEASSQNGKYNAFNFLSRLTVNEWLTLLVAFGSLVISYLTYRNAADTSDLKTAVANLGSLATEAAKQSAALQGQLKATQEQIDVMRTAQRPYVAVVKYSKPTVFQAPSGSKQILWEFHLTNLGRSFAKRLKYWSYISVDGKNFIRSYGATGPTVGEIPPDGGDIYSEIISAPLSENQVSTVTSEIGVLGAYITFSYTDDYNGQYSGSICLKMLKTGAISLPDPEQCKSQLTTQPEDH